MGLLRLSTLALLALSATSVLGQAEPIVEPVDENAEAPRVSANVAVKVSTSFPQAEIFGVKLINGYPTQALISFDNQDTVPVNVAFVGGSLWAPDPKSEGASDRIIRNLTSTRYNVQIPAGESESLTYSFATELHPQDLRLNILAVVMNDKGGVYTLNAYNETVSIVEPDASFFDPQLIFLYLMLLGLFAGSSYFIYNTWISTLFPQQQRGGKGGERAKKSSGGSKNVDSANAVAVVGADGPAVTTGSKTYDESWIPEHHLQRPEAKRSKSGGRPKTPKKTE